METTARDGPCPQRGGEANVDYTAEAGTERCAAPRGPMQSGLRGGELDRTFGLPGASGFVMFCTPSTRACQTWARPTEGV